MNARHSFLLVFLVLLLSGCEKKEQPLVLPPAGGALQGHVDMGENYTSQVFYDFENNSIVTASDPGSWHLAFESANRHGFHVFMNGGEGVLLYNSHLTDLSAVCDLPPNSSNPANWLIDAPCDLPDSTAVGDWTSGGISKKEVFIVQTDPTTYKKFQLLSVSDSAYVMAYGDLQERAHFTTITIPKDTAYSCSYFHFTRGLVKPEPPKAAWDVVFTRYRSLVWDPVTKETIPYLVTGALLNESGVSAAADSLLPFSQLTYDNTASLPRSRSRDVIGYDWKTYDIPTAVYTVNKARCYILNTRNGQVIKLHFLDFYSSAGVKGSPSFESQRIR